MIPVGHVDELGRDPEAGAGFPNTPFEKGFDVEFCPDFPDVDFFSLEGERGCPGDDPQVPDFGQLINSSASPSLKYSFSGSALMLRKGRTAMEDFGSS